MLLALIGLCFQAFFTEWVFILARFIFLVFISKFSLLSHILLSVPSRILLNT